jgi:hypothetical protein
VKLPDLSPTKSMVFQLARSLLEGVADHSDRSNSTSKGRRPLYEENKLRKEEGQGPRALKYVAGYSSVPRHPRSGGQLVSVRVIETRLYNCI